MNRRLFGKKSESIDPAQLELLFGDTPGKPEYSIIADALGEVRQPPSLMSQRAWRSAPIVGRIELLMASMVCKDRPQSAMVRVIG